MWGLRNPWRFSFDRATGALWIGDVGQNEYEEIDYAPAGQKGINWGWSAREGFHPFRGTASGATRDPLLETKHSDGTCAIVGGYVYRGKAIPALDGVYVFGDDCRPNLVGVVAVERKGRVASAISVRSCRNSPRSVRTTRARSTPSVAKEPSTASSPPDTNPPTVGSVTGAGST